MLGPLMVILQRRMLALVDCQPFHFADCDVEKIFEHAPESVFKTVLSSGRVADVCQLVDDCLYLLGVTLAYNQCRVIVITDDQVLNTHRSNGAAAGMNEGVPCANHDGLIGIGGLRRLLLDQR